MRPRVVLVVDDNHVNLKLTRVTLEAHGFRVLTATDAEQARRVIAEGKPGVVLMDLQLPGMDGLTLTRALKADPATRELVVLAVTAYAMKGDEDRARDAGCDGYIAKPIDTRALGAIVAAWFDRLEAP